MRGKEVLMTPVNTFKALTYRLLVFGFQPIDLVIILFLFVFVHGIGNSLLIDIIFLIPALILAKKGKNRPQGYFLSLLIYLILPEHLTVAPRSERAVPSARWPVLGERPVTEDSFTK